MSRKSKTMISLKARSLGKLRVPSGTLVKISVGGRKGVKGRRAAKRPTQPTSFKGRMIKCKKPVIQKQGGRKMSSRRRPVMKQRRALGAVSRRPAARGTGAVRRGGAGPVQGGEKWPAMERTHVAQFDEHAMVARVPIRQHVLLDVQRGRSKALRGRGVRGATPEEMRRLFGKKK